VAAQPRSPDKFAKGQHRDGEHCPGQKAVFFVSSFTAVEQASRDSFRALRCIALAVAWVNDGEALSARRELLRVAVGGILCRREPRRCGSALVGGGGGRVGKAWGEAISDSAQ
jgi:hypothetical protein